MIKEKSFDFFTVVSDIKKDDGEETEETGDIDAPLLKKKLN